MLPRLILPRDLLHATNPASWANERRSQASKHKLSLFMGKSLYLTYFASNPSNWCLIDVGTWAWYPIRMQGFQGPLRSRFIQGQRVPLPRPGWLLLFVTNTGDRDRERETETDRQRDRRKERERENTPLIFDTATIIATPSFHFLCSTASPNMVLHPLASPFPVLWLPPVTIDRAIPL